MFNDGHVSQPMHDILKMVAIDFHELVEASSSYMTSPALL